MVRATTQRIDSWDKTQAPLPDVSPKVTQVERELFLLLIAAVERKLVIIINLYIEREMVLFFMVWRYLPARFHFIVR